MRRISTLEDWIDLFYEWQDEIGLGDSELKSYKFETLFEDPQSEEIEFGAFKGRLKWKTLLHIPNQPIREALLNLVVYQGDTEFASVEQQRNLLNTYPNEGDLARLIRVMVEETRHGWQMSHVLIRYFGESGKIEAQKLLERHAYESKRLLHSFNEEIIDWLDFFTYTVFLDRDGKYQLTMLRRSGFRPLAASMGPMLKEEGFHLMTGADGLKRTLKKGRVPVPLLQKYFNKWASTSYDLFGKDHSANARLVYTYGLKARYDERVNSEPVTPDVNINDYNRHLYFEEVKKLTDSLNRLIPEDQPKLSVPDIKFNRQIGVHAGKCYTAQGEPMPEEEYPEYLASVIPGPQDYGEAASLFKEGDWIIPPPDKM